MAAAWLDPCASGPYFHHWVSTRGVEATLKGNWVLEHDEALGGPSVMTPKTWLLSTGWLRHGPIELAWVPGGVGGVG